MIVLTKQISTYKKTITYFGTAIMLIIIGYLSLNYLSSVLNFSRVAFSRVVTALEDTIYALSNLSIPLNISTISTTVFLAFSTWFMVKGFKSLKNIAKDSKVVSILSELPNNYYILNDVNINNTIIDHVVVCPKGVLTLSTRYWRSSVSGNQKHGIGNNQYDMIKQGIQNSKALNDFLQKNNIGNYFVKTIVVFDIWDEKLKGNFPEIPILPPEQLVQYIESLESKFSDDECKCVADALNNSIIIQNNFHSRNLDKQGKETNRKKNLHRA